MVRYSPYQRALMSTANFAVPKTMDFAANREAIRSAQQTSAAVSRVTNFAFKQFDEALKVEGAQAGARAPKETLQRMQGGAPTSTFDKAAYASAVQVGSMQIESEARSELGKLMLEAKKTKMSPDVLRSQLDALIDGFSNSIQMLDPIAGARLSRRLGSAAQSVFLDRSEDYLNETQEKLDASMIGLVDNVGEQVQLIARQGGTQAFKNFNELITETADTMAANGVGPKKVQKFINESQDVYHKERAKGEFRRAVQNNKGQEYIDNFIKDQPRGKKQSKGIDGDTQSVLLRSWKAELNSQGGRYNRQLKTANKSLSDVLKGFKNGAGVKQDTFAELTNTASVINDPALTATTERVVKFIKDVQEQEEGGPQALAGLVASLEAKAAKSPGGKSTSILDLNFRDIAKARLRDMQTAIEKDPYGYRLRSLGKTYAPPALNSPFELEAHIKNQQKAADYYGVKPNFFGEIQEDQLKKIFLGTDTKLKADVILNLRAAAGPNFIPVLSELGEKTDAQELAHTASLGNGDLLMQYLEGKEALDNDVKLAEFDDKKILERTYRDVTGDAFAGVKAKYGRTVLNAAKAIYARRIEGNERVLDKEKFEGILNELVGGTKNFGGFYKYKDTHLILPPNLERDDAAIEQRFNETIDDLYEYTDLSEDEDIMRPVFANKNFDVVPKEELKKAKLVSAAAGLYFLEYNGLRIMRDNIDSMANPYFVIDMR